MSDINLKIVVRGEAGSGKTTVAQKIADALESEGYGIVEIVYNGGSNADEDIIVVSRP